MDLIHLSVIIAFSRSSLIMDNVLCKLFSYSLSCFPRLLYRYSSLVAPERIYTAILLNGQWFEQTHIGRRLLVSMFIFVFVRATYEIAFIE